MKNSSSKLYSIVLAAIPDLFICLNVLMSAGDYYHSKQVLEIFSRIKSELPNNNNGIEQNKYLLFWVEIAWTD